MNSFWLLTLPLAAASSWWLGNRKRKNGEHEKKHISLPRNYLSGLNFLLNEEPDKALDVFIKMFEVDSETIETHLALGNLFRRRGEVNRAIRIHQNLIARPSLDDEIRMQALLALAKDYLYAGVLDRAERLFLELVGFNRHAEDSLRYLLDIYQQEKEWQKAINIAQKLLKHDPSINVAIAHYYCELAELSIEQSAFEQAVKYLKRAFSVDKACVRASLLSAKIASNAGNHKRAIQYLKRIKDQDLDFFSEAVFPLVKEHQSLSKEKELVLYFRDILKTFPKIPIVIMLSEQIRELRSDKTATALVTNYVRQHPSIAGLHSLVELYLPLTEGKTKQDLTILHSLTERLLADQPQYQCIQCGFAGKMLLWQCPSCKKWNSIRPTHTLE